MGHSYLNIMTGNIKFGNRVMTPWEIELGHYPPVKMILGQGVSDEGTHRPQSDLDWSDFKQFMNKKQDQERSTTRQINFRKGELVGFHRKGDQDKAVERGTVIHTDEDTV